MVRPLATILGSAFLVGVALASVPEILIVQRKVAKTKAEDPNFEIGDYVAQELMDAGKVSPIYWSPNDAIFRSMVASGKAPNIENPSLQDAEDLAKRNRFDYVLVVEAHKNHSGKILARAELYKGADQIWADPDDVTKPSPALIAKLRQNKDISAQELDEIEHQHGFRELSVTDQGQINMYNTLRSAAHTWAEQIALGPLRGVIVQPEQQSPDALPGPLADLSPTAPQPAKKVDNKQLFDSVESAMRDKKPDDAVLLLREGVDSAPFDFDRRSALINLLNRVGRPDLAAAEAARAALIDPTQPAFRLAGARAALMAGRLDEAETAAKDALAHDGKNAEADLVLGIVDLRRGNNAEAVRDLSNSIAVGSTPEALFYRAYASAMVGDVSGSAKDGDAWLAAATPGFTADYGLVLGLLDKGMDSLFDAVRMVLPSITVGGTADSSASVTGISNACVALSALLARIDVPNSHSASHQRRLLALKLLNQSCGELADALAKRGDDPLADARIDLGEAMKQYKAAGDAYVTESNP